MMFDVMPTILEDGNRDEDRDTESPDVDVRLAGDAAFRSISNYGKQNPMIPFADDSSNGFQNSSNPFLSSDPSPLRASSPFSVIPPSSTGDSSAISSAMNDGIILGNDSGAGGETGRSSTPNSNSAGIEQLMVSLLDERDRLLETMRSLQEQVALGAQRAAQLEKERDLLAEHINATMPNVRNSFCELCIDPNAN